MDFQLVDETLREGDARGYHTHPPEKRAQLIQTIRDITGINEFSLGMAVVNDNEHATLQCILEARRSGALPRSFRVHVYGWFQIHDRCLAYLSKLSPADRECIYFDMAMNASDTLARSQDIPWLTANGWLKGAPDAEALLKARCAAMDSALRRYTDFGLAGVGILLQDGFRSTETELDACIEAGLAGGGQGVRLHDTVGVATPLGVKRRLEHLAGRFPGVGVHVHFHNDFGMATANTVTALTSGACGADVTVNGVGNRAGNACTQEVLMGLKVLHGMNVSGVNYSRFTELAEVVETHFLLARSPYSPVIGPILHLDESSTRTHLLHTTGHTTWHPYSPTDVGAEPGAAHSPTSGPLAVELTLQRAAEDLASAGVTVDRALIDRAYAWVSAQRGAREQRHRPEAAAAMRAYQEALRSSYVTDDDLVATALQTSGRFDR